MRRGSEEGGREGAVGEDGKLASDLEAYKKAHRDREQIAGEDANEKGWWLTDGGGHWNAFSRC